MRSLLLLVVALLAACDPVESSSDDSPAIDAGEGPDAATTCTAPGDCTDPAAPVCAADGVCVGCETDPDCSGDTPICDGERRECRGCSQDAECAGGICVEADGRCIVDAEVAFLADGGTDTGTCPRSAPCATFAYAIAQLAGRVTVHVLGGSFSSTTPFTINDTLILDGKDVQLEIYGTSIDVAESGDVIIEGFQLVAPAPVTEPSPAAINIRGPAKVRIHDVAIDGDGGVTVLAGGYGDVWISAARIGRQTSLNTNVLDCTGGTLLLEDSVIEKTRVSGTSGCELTVRRNRFASPNDGSVAAEGGRLVMENNLLVHSGGYNDSIYATNLSTGSTIRFNTIVNTTPVPSDGSALYCDGSVLVTSNIFAYQSGHPVTGPGDCEVRYSIFDSISQTSAGIGNQVSDDLFVGEGDYHLSETSPARGGAEPGQTMVKDDLEGNPRPTSGPADCGAFEAE